MRRTGSGRRRGRVPRKRRQGQRGTAAASCPRVMCQSPSGPGRAAPEGERCPTGAQGPGSGKPGHQSHEQSAKLNPPAEACEAGRGGCRSGGEGDSSKGQPLIAGKRPRTSDAAVVVAAAGGQACRWRGRHCSGDQLRALQRRPAAGTAQVALLHTAKAAGGKHEQTGRTEARRAQSPCC